MPEFVKQSTAAPPGRLVDVGGHRLHVVCRGSGSPLVLLESGIAASSVSWALIQPQLAELTTACAYDRAGFAWSEPPVRPRTFERILDELDAVLASCGAARRAVLVGHSFGSLIVLGYTARHPDRVEGLVLIDPPLEWISATAQQTQMLVAARYLSRLGAQLARAGLVRIALSWLTGGRPSASRRVAYAFGSRVGRTLERIVGEVRKLPEELHPVMQEHWCQPKCFHAMADHLMVLQREATAIGRYTLPPDVPLVVITGSHQPAHQVEAHRALAASSSRGRHVTASKSGHWILFDEPELVVAAVRSLIEGSNARRQQLPTATGRPESS
jgi:pimeloyl-ACP methyl ester carboxylesterase